MIETQGLSKRFGNTTAVENLDLQIRNGEVFGFLGPNGAGKTTTVRMLSCLVAPSEGQAVVAGLRVGADNREIRRLVGILTETPGLYDRLSATANLRFYGQLYGIGEEKLGQQIRRYLDMLGLWSQRDRPVSGFSKGMKQKLAIARALLHEPRVLLLDEPTSGLDPESAHTVREFIAELKEQGRTTLLCTHNLDEADRLCDRVGIIRQHIIRQGTPAELRHQLYGRRIVIQLSEITDAVRDRVASLPFVQSWEQARSSLTVKLSDPEAQNPILISEIVQAGGAIQFVTEEKATLEDVYLSLVQGGPQS